MIVSFFIAIIIILQLARMGVLNNPKQFENRAYTPAQTFSVDLPDIPAVMTAVIIRNSGDARSVYYSKNIAGLFEKYGVGYEIAEASGPVAIKEDTDCVILTMSDYTDYGDYGELFAYARRGGALIFAAPPETSGTYQSLTSTLGITENTDGRQSNYIVDKKGLVGKPGTKYSYYEMVTVSRAVRLRAECDVYLEDEGGTALLWRTDYGAGEIFAANSDLIAEKTGRGALSCILAEIARKSLLYPCYDVFTSSLESFPGPAISGEYEIFRKYNKSYDAFVKDILWVDLLRLTRTYGVRHTISFVQSYGSETKAPFDKGALLASTLLTYGGEALSNKGELATHGYNYRPLALRGELFEKSWFEPWASFGDIAQATDINVKFKADCFPNYKIKCYYPPEGRIGASILSRLGDIMPDAETICAPYHNRLGDQVFADFQTERDGYFYYATTSGIEGLEWNAQNSALSLGIVSQSIDIPYAVTVDRVPWDDVYKGFKGVCEKVFGMFPDMERLTVSQAAGRIKQYNAMKFVYEEDENGMNVYISGYFNGASFLLRTRKTPAEGEGYTARAVSPGVYEITPAGPSFRIGWEADR